MNSTEHVRDGDVIIDRRVACSLLVSLLGARACWADKRDRWETTPATEAALDRGLEWLAANQGAQGNWSSNDLGLVSMGALAFMAGGHMPGRGRYGKSGGDDPGRFQRRQRFGLVHCSKADGFADHDQHRAVDLFTVRQHREVRQGPGKLAFVRMGGVLDDGHRSVGPRPAPIIFPATAAATVRPM